LHEMIEPSSPSTSLKLKQTIKSTDSRGILTKMTKEKLKAFMNMRQIVEQVSP
jgi:hypothetical protein